MPPATTKSPSSATNRSRPTPRRLTDQMMARFDGPNSPGAAVRVWRDGRTLYSKTYGMANLAYGIPVRGGHAH